MALVYGIGGLISVPQGAVSGIGAPPLSFRGELGQQYFDRGQSPPLEYVFNGQTWTTGGSEPASTTVYGSVLLSTLAQLEAGTAPAGSVVPLANDVFTFVNSVVIANLSTEAAVGLIQQATDAQSVAGTNLNPGTPLAVQPKSLAAVFASNPAIGGTAPNTAVVTTLGFTTATGTAGGTWASGGTAISIGADASADAINLGTGAAARTITFGNSTDATSLVFNCGTGATGLKLNAAGNVQMVPATSSTASATTTAVMNNRVGVATFTGFTTASAATADFTITNSTVLTTSGILVTVANLNASTNGAEMTLIGVTQAAGSFIVHLKNNGGGSLGAGDNVLITFWVIS